MTCSHDQLKHEGIHVFMLSKSEDEGCHLLSLTVDLERFEK
jgi:hypothetical protein